MYILGISAFYHDAAAVLISNGKIVAAVQEERFTRRKHDESFPVHSIRFCLELENIGVNDIDAVVFYEKPFIKFERLLETYLSFAPNGLLSFLKAIPVWSKKKLFIKKIIRDELKKLNEGKKCTSEIIFSTHHLSHAASACYTSSFPESAILVIDAVGESATTTILHSKGNTVTLLKEMHFPHSAGLLYSAFTYFLGFKVNSGEYKLMGLAPYGNNADEQTQNFRKLIEENLCTVYNDGSVFLHQEYFNYATGFTMAKDKKWEKLFGFKKRSDDEKISNEHCNLALAIQNILDDIVIKLAREAKKMTGCNNLCMAGGVALNCVTNSRLQEAGIFDRIHIQPAAGDAGGAIGAALAAWHIYFGKERNYEEEVNNINGTYLGPEFSNEVVENILKQNKAVYSTEEDVYQKVAVYVAEGNVIGWFRGRMEFGPRALGNRSIIADPANAAMQQKINGKIKFREGFRPFAPSVKLENVSDYFETDKPSPYMLYVMQLDENYKKTLPAEYDSYSIEEKLNYIKSSYPAITHADGSARLQTVDKQTNPCFWKLLSAVEEETGSPMLINTSFNVRGEPIVCTPEDALRCFMNTDMDVLVLQDHILLKSEQKNIRSMNYSKDQILKD
ncbi:MAG: carbamoyltransferase N-terminal domain-containing protein [Ferruginibacter sp.]